MRADPLSVLVVDDDTQMLRTTTDILRLHGYIPMSAESGLTALELASTMDSAPAIALVDLQLPDMDGIELITRLRSISALTEVVVLTGNASMESAVFALRERSYDYLIKPVPPDHLMATIDRAGERSERRRAEAGRQESEERLRLIFDHVSDALFVANTTGQILDVNPAACELTGLSVDDLVSTSLEDVLPESTSIGARASAPAHGDARLEIAAGNRVLDVQASVFAPGVLVYTVRDLTKQRLLEQQLIQSQKMEAVGQLAGGVAHDFNNLLTVIMSYSSLVLESLPPDDLRRPDIQEIADAAERGSGLTQRLLAFSRKQVVQLRPVSVNAIVTDVERILRRLIGEHIELTTDLDPDLSLINGDPGQLEQILINLAVNARDAMPEGGEIHISTTDDALPDAASTDKMDVAPGPYIMLAVTDTGTGMTRDTQQRVFEPFFTTKESGKGTGLGLSTVYGIVKQSAGAIAIDSRMNEGTTFRIYLPSIDGELDDSPEHASTQSPFDGHETVLIAEDDESLRTLAARALRRHGYTVLLAADGAEALKIVRQNPEAVDIVASDMVMPGMGGRELMEQLQAIRKDIKVLLMSGYTSDAIIHRGVFDRRTGFLQKPFTPYQFAKNVREVLDRPAATVRSEPERA